ncbi:peptidylprolyl isomerase [Mucilaginibacter sp. 14171R-50]|uniref:FKBP-type peptidyl-prolyl cis-trans isomerase n=1 Tax=Mucilaginibacter sp. 14171R-50 TaxID=2703789 RepID=UPI00138B7891|nr:FKBP-type peptidyl-prolyl cis-trans isomerase [Mucilaginibacter sp. 14171R-50]QHS55604.1 peptidylprolyl isomerase [Mucilaginibacter sp. 14171R-50]
MKNTFYLVVIFSLLTLTAAAQFKQTSSGVQYQVISNAPGQKIKQNDIITFQAVQCTDKDSVLFSTYQQGQPVKAQVRPSANVADLMDIFPLLAVNDSAVVRVPVDSVFKGHETEMPPIFKKGGNIVFKLKILQVQTLEEAMAERNAAMAKMKAEGEKLKAAEAAKLEGYINSNKIIAKTTPSGLRYVIKQAGNKPKPLKGDTIYVNYTGRTLEGKMFDSSIEADAKAGGLNQPGRPYEPISFALGTGRVIPGWDEAFLLMNEGSKAKLIIPSALAYGEYGSGADITPYAPLVFDVELVKVVRVKHPATIPAAKAPLKKKTAVKKRTAVKKKN